MRRRPDLEVSALPAPQLGGAEHRSRLLQGKLLADPSDHGAAAELIGS